MAGLTLLIVEDNATIRDMITEMATEFGFEVTPVSSGELALDYLSKTSVDVLLCDLLLGAGISGVELISQRNIQLPTVVILMSGDPVPISVPAGTRFLAKPFTIKALQDILRP